MSSATKDPRDGAQKRRASRSPDPHGVQPKRSMQNFNPADPRNKGRAPARASSGTANGLNGVASRRNSDQFQVSRSSSTAPFAGRDVWPGNSAPPAAPAPVAQMGGHVTSRAGVNKVSFTKLMMESQSQAATVAMCQMSLNQAEAARTRALREFKANQHNFGEFQAIAEQKNTAKVRTEERFRLAEYELQQAIARQKTITEELSELIFLATETPPPPPPPPPPPVVEPSPIADVVSREQFDGLKAELSEVRDSLKSLQSSISVSANDTMSKVDSKIAAMPHKDFSADIDAMATRAKLLEQSLQELRSSSATVSEVQDVKSNLKALDSRVEKAESAAKSMPQAVAPMAPSAPLANQSLTPVLQRLTQVEADMTAMARDLPDDIKDANTSTVEEMEAQIERFRERFTVEMDNKLAEQWEALSAWRDAITVLQRNMQTCIGDHSILQTSQQELKTNIDALSQRTSSEGAPSLANGQTPGLLSFAPVAPVHDVGIDRNPFEKQLVNGTEASYNGTHLTHMKNDIEMLKERERLHTHQYSNLITDQVVENMVDAMAKQYPDVKNAYASMQLLTTDLNTLRARTNNAEHAIARMQNDLANLSNTVSSTDRDSRDLAQRMNSTENNTATTKREAVKLRDELSALATRVDQHAQAVEAGTGHMKQLGDDLHKAFLDIAVLDGKLGILQDVQKGVTEHSVNGTG
ncbi:unnamed protein product [Zymoseptoria tritici ST99CH_1E4]|uniref:Uncharacterized protein n=1 Tax=Zymoseptoria tritici ST99CH_1E4 TaxID=1276532 RepID=A0A2H1FYA6_ZYMTR|nr:unnamed protein product [Zymoseptoria tritici ST99CH_1E4]